MRIQLHVMILSLLTLTCRRGNNTAYILLRIAVTLDVLHLSLSVTVPRGERSVALHLKSSAFVYLQRSIRSESHVSDGVPCFIVRRVVLFSVMHLTYLVNESLKSGIFPNNMKVNRVAPIHKKIIIQKLPTCPKFQNFLKGFWKNNVRKNS